MTVNTKHAGPNPKTPFAVPPQAEEVNVGPPVSVEEALADRKREAEAAGRRQFLFQMAGLTASGLMINLVGGGKRVEASSGAGSEENGRHITNLPEKGYHWEDHLYAYLIDTKKCIGCGMCVRACKNENQVPDGYYRTWIEEYLIGFEDGEFDVQVHSPNGGLFGFEAHASHLAITKGFYVPKMCNHCEEAPCVQVCPVGASYRTVDGVVLVDQERCMGCGYCVQACPYGARFMEPRKDKFNGPVDFVKNQKDHRHHTATKCTWCYHRITKGLRPACVQACPTMTRSFGDLKRADDPVLIALAHTRVQVLQPELLTKPRCFYIGLDKEVR